MTRNLLAVNSVKVVHTGATFGLALILFSALPQAAMSQPHQPIDFSPRETQRGVLFQCRAPDAEHVYLAGDFNDWAHNQNGFIQDNQYRMHGPDTNGVFSRTVRLVPGVYSFKFCIGGKPDGWFTPGNTRYRDGEGNALIIVDGKYDESVDIKSAQLPYRDKNEWVFEIHDPDANIIFLAGSFNNWANNDNGSVHDHQFAMSGPDIDGIWRKRLRMTSGIYRYQFVINGATWIPNPLDQNSISDDHSILEVP